MRSIILDTSFLIKCLEWHIDLFSEIDRVCSFPFELRFIDRTVDELESYALQGGKEKANAKLARLFLARAKVVKSKGGGLVDDLIVDFAKDHVGAIVATHDKDLKNRVKDVGRQIIFIRQKKYLLLE